MENQRLLFTQNKRLKTQTFYLEGHTSASSETRRKSIYADLTSERGLLTKTEKTLIDNQVVSASVRLRFSIEHDVVILRILDPVTDAQIGYIRSANVFDGIATEVEKAYGKDKALTNDTDPDGYQARMKKLYESKGVMKGALACFLLALEENGITISETFVNEDNYASINSGTQIPPLENIHFETTSEVAWEADPPASTSLLRLTTRIIRT